ncbi:sigma-70 family RNA polymerase sigma factor [Reichenbachiella sp. MALMAid0571]|uniref:RNA polymerase sigma factor n=1 Tax=Reichenbachiella sp. MALMAid0571 TaxID=3143939 RepID=UPI0032E05360
MSDRFSAFSDAELWTALRNGDQKALGHIYNQNIQHLYRFGFQYSKDRELIKDCIQDIFISIGKKKDSSQTIHSIKSYLFKALYRELMYKIKKNKKYRESELNELFDGFSIEISMESHLIHQENIKEKISKVKLGLNNLSPKQRQVILHYYYDGLTYDEIADVMEIQHKNTVAKLIKRALDTLRQNVAISLLFAFLLSFFL